jgi:predicted phosphodiesterase
MEGIYTGPSEDSFKDDSQIKREAYLAGDHPSPNFVTPLSVQPTFQEYSARFRRRQTERGEKYQNVAEVQLFDTSLISFQSDLHIGGEEVDYARIEQEAEVIVNTPNSYVVLMGDLIDNFSFTPPAHETLDVVPEQIKYARSLIKYYADNKKLIGAYQGNHETWSSRQGVDLYTFLLDGIETYFFFGMGYIKAKVVDEEYRITGNHQFQGHSMYNNTHGQNRALRFGGGWGSDVIVSGHWHEKGLTQQPLYEYGGESYIANMIALGTYKENDGYTRNKGFSNRDPNSMYGAAVRLDKDKHLVTPHYDILQAHEAFLGG